MILNAENVLKFLPNGLGQYGAKAQCGIDLSVCNINRIIGGEIGIEGKNILPYKSVDLIYKNDHYYWKLDKGVYSLTFDQGIKLDNKHCAEVIARSTMRRIACDVRSSLFDPGFECDNIGATLYVYSEEPIIIEKHSRLAQIVIKECEESEEYEGSYKGNKDLK